MHIGVKIKIARITKGYTQEQLAEKINKTRPLVSHIEQTGKVNAYTLKKICQVLEIDPADLEGSVFEPRANYQKDNQLEIENKRLREEIAVLKELISMQRDVITGFRQKKETKKKPRSS